MADSGEKPESEEVCKFFPKSLKDKNFRKRTVEEDDTESKSESTFLLQSEEKHRSPIINFISLPGSQRILNPVLPSFSLNLRMKFRGGFDGDAKLYKGIHGYTDHKAGFWREQTVAGKKVGVSHGPPRASAYVRATARIDHQPDIYGDSCKFLHDR
ncbi:hypothetical protein TIFTF001_012495 [Ficus carica]|uniref:Uncharacterized protein n=1 Tax=Ficus carica TaxID=3494 RepID=A0AA88D1V2_FICCA|nr:hypothetical protein TIFTF001_012495 [Ficus carica]